MPSAKTIESLDDYAKKLVAEGILGADLQPLKCERCGSTKSWKYGKGYSEGSCLIEFEAVCQDCGHTMGYWAYGNWQL